MSGGGSSNYLMGGLKTAGGLAATAFGAPEIGLPLMLSGAGQLAGQGAGGSKGASMGSEIGGLAGGGLEGLSALGAGGTAGMTSGGGLTGALGLGGLGNLPGMAKTGIGNLFSGQSTPTTPSMYTPGQQGAPGMGDINSALASNPLLSSLQGQVQGVSEQAPAPGSGGMMGKISDFLSSPTGKLLQSPAAQQAGQAVFGGGAGGGGQQQTTQPTPPAPQPPQQMSPRNIPGLQTPQVPQAPQAAGTTVAGGGGGGGGQGNPLQQLLAMMGMQKFA